MAAEHRSTSSPALASPSSPSPTSRPASPATAADAAAAAGSEAQAEAQAEPGVGAGDASIPKTSTVESAASDVAAADATTTDPSSTELANAPKPASPSTAAAASSRRSRDAPPKSIKVDDLQDLQLEQQSSSSPTTPAFLTPTSTPQNELQRPPLTDDTPPSTPPLSATAPPVASPKTQDPSAKTSVGSDAAAAAAAATTSSVILAAQAADREANVSDSDEAREAAAVAMVRPNDRAVAVTAAAASPSPAAADGRVGSSRRRGRRKRPVLHGALGAAAARDAASASSSAKQSSRPARQQSELSDVQKAMHDSHAATPTSDDKAHPHSTSPSRTEAQVDDADADATSVKQPAGEATAAPFDNEPRESPSSIGSAQTGSRSSVHDLSWSPQRARNSLVDNMLLSLDHMAPPDHASPSGHSPLNARLTNGHGVDDMPLSETQSEQQQQSSESATQSTSTTGATSRVRSDPLLLNRAVGAESVSKTRTRGHTFSSASSTSTATPATLTRRPPRTSSLDGASTVPTPLSADELTRRRSKQSSGKSSRQNLARTSDAAINNVSRASGEALAAGTTAADSEPSEATRVSDAVANLRQHRRSASRDAAWETAFAGASGARRLPPLIPPLDADAARDAAPMPNVPAGPRNRASQAPPSRNSPSNRSSTMAARRSSVRAPRGFFNRGSNERVDASGSADAPAKPRGHKRSFSAATPSSTAKVSQLGSQNVPSKAAANQNRDSLSVLSAQSPAGKENKPGFFKRMFGGSRSGTPATPPAEGNKAAAHSRNESKGAASPNEVTKSGTGATGSKDKPSKEAAQPALNKKASFFRRRRRSPSDAGRPSMPSAQSSRVDSPPASAALPRAGLPEGARTQAAAGDILDHDLPRPDSQPSSLRRVMDPYLSADPPPEEKAEPVTLPPSQLGIDTKAEVTSDTVEASKGSTDQVTSPEQTTSTEAQDTTPDNTPDKSSDKTPSEAPALPSVSDPSEGARRPSMATRSTSSPMRSSSGPSVPTVAGKEAVSRTRQATSSIDEQLATPRLEPKLPASVASAPPVPRSAASFKRASEPPRNVRMQSDTSKESEQQASAQSSLTRSHPAQKPISEKRQVVSMSGLPQPELDRDHVPPPIDIRASHGVGSPAASPGSVRSLPPDRPPPAVPQSPTSPTSPMSPISPITPAFPSPPSPRKDLEFERRTSRPFLTRIPSGAPSPTSRSRPVTVTEPLASKVLDSPSSPSTPPAAHSPSSSAAAVPTSSAIAQALPAASAGLAGQQPSATLTEAPSSVTNDSFVSAGSRASSPPVPTKRASTTSKRFSSARLSLRPTPRPSSGMTRNAGASDANVKPSDTVEKPSPSDASVEKPIEPAGADDQAQTAISQANTEAPAALTTDPSRDDGREAVVGAPESSSQDVANDVSHSSVPATILPSNESSEAAAEGDKNDQQSLTDPSAEHPQETSSSTQEQEASTTLTDIPESGVPARDVQQVATDSSDYSPQRSASVPDQAVPSMLGKLTSKSSRPTALRAQSADPKADPKGSVTSVDEVSPRTTTADVSEAGDSEDKPTSASAEEAAAVQPTPDDYAAAEKLYNGTFPGVEQGDTIAWLGDQGEDRKRIRAAYMEQFDWKDMSILGALRSLCNHTVLRGETQAVDRVIDALSTRWCECNPNHGFFVTDVVHTICYSILLLNTDLYLADLEQHMTRPQFIKNTLSTVRRVVIEAAPNAFESNRFSIMPGLSASPDVALLRKVASASGDSDETLIMTSRISKRLSTRYLGDNDASAQDHNHDECGPLVQKPFQGKLSAWEAQMDLVLKNFYNCIRHERLPLSEQSHVTPQANERSTTPIPGASASTAAGSAALAPLNTNSSGVLRRTNSLLNRSPSELSPSTRGRLGASNSTAPSATSNDSRASSRWSTSKTRSRARMYPSSLTAPSRTSLDDDGTGTVGSALTPSSSSMWSKYSHGRTQTSSMSVHSFSTDTPRGADFQPSIGFANALTNAFTRDDLSADGMRSGGVDEALRSGPVLDDESLELAGAPWAKEGILQHKHHLEAVDKKSRDRSWNECFAVLERGWMRLFQFSTSSKSLKHRHRGLGLKSGASTPALGAAAPTGAVGGGNWTENARPLGSFMLRHTIASALPEPGYSKTRPHVFALSLPTGAVHLFQGGTPEIVSEWVATANYWGARLSKEPLTGGVSNVEYGWSDRIINLAAIPPGPNTSGSSLAESTAPSSRALSPTPTMDGRLEGRGSVSSAAGEPRMRSGSGAGLGHQRSSSMVPAPRPSLQSTIRGSLEHGTGSSSTSTGSHSRPRLPGDRVQLADWKPPAQSMLASQLLEVDQLKALSAYVASIEEELRRHTDLRPAILTAFTPRYNNHAKALANWERKSAHLLREIVKFQTYTDSLLNAASTREKIYEERRARDEARAQAAAEEAARQEDARAEASGEKLTAAAIGKLPAAAQLEVQRVSIGDPRRSSQRKSQRQSQEVAPVSQRSSQGAAEMLQHASQGLTDQGDQRTSVQGEETKRKSQRASQIAGETPAGAPRQSQASILTARQDKTSDSRRVSQRRSAANAGLDVPHYDDDTPVSPRTVLVSTPAVAVTAASPVSEIDDPTTIHGVMSNSPRATDSSLTSGQDLDKETGGKGDDDDDDAGDAENASADKAFEAGLEGPGAPTMRPESLTA